MPDATSNGYFDPENDFKKERHPLRRLSPELAPDIFNGPAPLQFFLPDVKTPAFGEQQQVFWQGLRSFFLTGQGGGLPKQRQLRPAAIAPFYQSHDLRLDFPVWIPDADTLSQTEFETTAALSVWKLLEAAVQRFAPEVGEAELLKSQLSRITRILRQKLDNSGAGEKAALLWEQVFAELQKELQVKGVEGLMLAADLTKLQRALPPGGVCIPLASATPFAMLSCLLEQFQHRRNAWLSRMSEELVPKLKTILNGSGEKITGTSASREPLQQLLEAIESTSAQSIKDNAYLFVSRELQEKTGWQWDQRFPHAVVRVLGADELFEAAMLQAERLKEAEKVLFSDLYMAEATSGATSLAVQMLPESEGTSHAIASRVPLAVFPPVMVFSDGETLAGLALGSLVNCISEGQPIKIFSHPVSPGSAPAELPGIVAMLGNAWVCQSNALDPSALLEELSQGIAFAGPAFFQIAGFGVPAVALSTHTFLNTLALLESRIFPGLCFDPAKGPSWSSRFGLTGNADPDQDWCTYSISVSRNKSPEQLSLSITPADYMSLLPEEAAGFKVVEPEYWTDELVPVEQLLQADMDYETDKRIPYIWMADEALMLCKVAVSRRLLRQCRRSLERWNMFREYAGINNTHNGRDLVHPPSEVSQLVGDEGLMQAHAEAAVKQAMEQLAAALLETDFSGQDVPLVLRDAYPVQTVAKAAEVEPIPEIPVGGNAGEQQEGAAEKPVVAAVPVEKPKKQSPVLEAWIETPSCTSCSECVDNYPGIFSYNEDKQAYVVDPRGGSFADIVRAAERCPVRIIHPGTPWEEADAGLAEWIERAAPYQ